ncbi:unnamed protein product [Litomosoides sigmodontis]|uniref:Metallo-beta-lactamase domain-containing protein n=1 Tax=Litomosoides sigmodontis TaxID=42156 RepID=A0A3P6TW09_LITSI|nr:unnamed protein product [Litomosoides sigmodontis]
MPQPGVIISGFIAIDKFPKDDSIKYYFLTHAHSDHYGAIDNKWNNGTIYCSAVTARVLPIVTQRPRSKRCGIQNHVVHALDLNVWHQMDGFSVMLLDANHVPGSVMLLFEGDRIPNGRILFTGDFRADVRFYQNAFAVSVLQEMSLNTIYLDTTYINCTRKEFPSREASLTELCSILRELLFDCFKPIAIMVPKIGREQLLVDVAVEFKCKIWVDHVRFQVAEILRLNDYFTTEKTETSIWTCTRQNLRSVLYNANVHVIDISMLRYINPNVIMTNERIRYVEYSDHSSPNEIRDFLSQLSFSQVIGLSVQLPQKQVEELERLSLMGFSDVSIRTENDELIIDDELTGLGSSAIRSRIGLASDHALRNVFDAEILKQATKCVNAVHEPRLEVNEEHLNPVPTVLGSDKPVENLQSTGLSIEAAAEPDEKLQRVDQEIKKATDDEDDYIFNLTMRKITRADYTNLTTRVCMELNNSENSEEDNPLCKILNELDFSKEIENLDDLSEKYRETVNIARKMQTVHDMNLPYNVQENVSYNTSRAPHSIDIPLEWLDESGVIIMVITGTNSEICFELERLFLHLALINDDSKLEVFTRKHLLDIIQCTSAGDVEVRNKGMEILTHLNRRIKSNLMVTLPLNDILHYLLSSQGNVLGTNFAIVYLKIALDRLDIKDHSAFLPNLLDGLLKYIYERKIFDQLIVLTKCAWISIANVNQQLWPSLESLQNKVVRSEILKFFSDVLYFPNLSENRTMTVLSDNYRDHPCMSKNRFLRIAKGVLSDSKVSLTALKLAVINILSSKIFDEAEILPLLIGAVALGPTEVEVAGDLAIKKIDLEKVLENKDTVNSLFNLYLGLSLQNCDEQDAILPASVPIKLKLMPLLMRSHIAIQIFPCNIKVAFDGLFSKEDFVQNKPLRLQRASIEFLLLIVKNFPANALPTFGPIIFSSIRKLIDQSESSSVVAIAYQCFGITGYKVPQLVINNIALLQETFDAMSSAPEEVSFAIADCLVSWIPAFCALNDVALSGVLEALISSYIIHESPKCRLVALKFVEALVKTSSLGFRWMLCRTCGDPRDEMKREALRLLDLSVANPATVPKFEDLVEFVHRKLNLQDATGGVDFSTAEAKKKKKAFADEVFHTSTLYLYASLQVACSLQPISLLEADIFSRASDYPVISNYLHSIGKDHPEILHFFLEIVLKAIEAQPGNFLIEIACLFLYSGGENLSYNYTAIVSSLERHLNSNSRTIVCAKLSQLYSLMLSDKEKKKCLEQCLKQLDSHDELPVRIPWLCSYLATQPLVDMSAGEINKIRVRLVNIIETLSAQQYFEAACGSLAELLRRAVFTLSEVEKSKLMSSVSDNQFHLLCELLGKIAASRKDTLTSKMKESAARCLGFLSLHHLPTILYEKILAQLFACGEIGAQPELQFTVGNALFDAALGESSPSRRNIFTETEEHFLEKNLSTAERDIIERKITNLLETLNAKLHHVNRHLRQAALIWLFTLVKRCAVMKLNCVMSDLTSLQYAFINGLTETNEFSQEIASEGIGVVFELGSEEQKKVMVEELINTLSDGRKRAELVTPDTVLFAKGELGTTPMGQNLTTYKELCNLATDLNQPDLIYKFMQLANHNILWNSKKGAAFGFSIIIQQAKNAIEPYLAQLVPKLYRYRYDPDLKVQGVMRSIWQAVTVSKKNVIEEYANTIFSELKLTLVDSQWRTRESSCLALADLISSHCTNEIVEHFGQLFEILYRVQDDIRESVRVAAGRALSSLTKATVCRCSSFNGFKATELLGIVLPVIIEKGVRSSVKANKMLSLKMIMDIAKEAGSTLQEHTNVIVPCLLDSLSEEESTVLNYLAARSNLDELEVLDSARVSVAHSSPMMNALRYVVPYVDMDVFNSLSDKLLEQLRSSVGVTTRTGSCQFIIDLCLQRKDLMMACQSSCDKLVRVLLNGLNDRNPVIKKQFSSCLSYLLPFSSKKEMNRIMNYVKLKLRSEQDEEKVTVLYLLRFLSRNTGVLSGSLTDVVPFIFLNKCQEVTKDDVAGKKRLEMWDELWSELVPDTTSAMCLYRVEMIEMALVTLNASSIFAMKAQAAKVLAAVAESGVLKDDVNCAEMLYDNLTSALRGRIWDGKEKLIEAISALLRSAGKTLSSKWDEATVKMKFSALWEQCLKKNEKYSGEAILCTAVFCEITGCNDIAQQMMAHLCSVIHSSHSDPNSDDIADNVGSTNHCDYLTKIVPAIAHLLISFHGVELSHHIEQTVALLKSDMFWKVKRALIIELPYFIQRCSSDVDLTALFVVLGSLLIENDIMQRRTFARQCCIVLECITKQTQNGRCILLLCEHKDFVETLKKTTVVNSSPLLDYLPKYEQ